MDKNLTDNEKESIPAVFQMIKPSPNSDFI